MSKETSECSRFFSVEEANAALPLVRAICNDLATRSRDLVDRRERLSLLLEGRNDGRDDMYREELVQIEEELERDSRCIEGYIQELRELGVEPKNAMEGLVDFPSKLDGRVVLLCWKLDEPEVLYWHEIEDGFRGRQPLVVGSGATDESAQLNLGDTTGELDKGDAD